MAEQPIPAAKTQAADPAMYYRVFVQNAEGALVLEDLLARFHDRKIWVAGGAEGARETERRSAQQEVVRFILGRTGQLPEAREQGDTQ
jgi:hypothetical protein